MDDIFVTTNNGQMRKWDKNIICEQLVLETDALKGFFGIDGITKEEAQDIASETERRINFKKHPIIASSLVREITNQILLEKSQKARKKEDIIRYDSYRKRHSRVGLPVYDAYMIDVGDANSFEKNENANVQGNPETSHKKKADKVSKEQYLLLMPPDIADKHIGGDIHIHDLEYFGTRPFCADWDLRYFFKTGFLPDGKGTRSAVAGPAMKPAVAVLHAVKILAAGQTNCAGGQGFYNFIPFIAPYMRGLSYEDIKQLMQELVYETSQVQVARGGQIVFSSLQLSPGIPELWQDIAPVYKGKVWNNQTYGDFENEAQSIFRALMDVMMQGDYLGKPFNFPKPEISMEPYFMNNSEYDDLYKMSIELSAKFGTPYFDNQMPEYRGAGKGISCYQCCAFNFTNDKESDTEFDDKLNFVDGKHFSMGSWQVVTINMPRIAYKSNGNDDLLLENIKIAMDNAVKVFNIKKSWMTRILNADRVPFLTQRALDHESGKRLPDAYYLNDLVYTIGIVGIHDMIKAHTGQSMNESREAYRLAIKLLFDMKQYARELEQIHNIRIAVARTPAETVAQRFAVSDLLSSKYKEQASSIVQGDVNTAVSNLNKASDLPVYYTNGAMLPPSTNISLLDKINIEQVFFPILDGGNIFHIFLGEKSPDIDALSDLTNKIARNTQIGYFAVTKDMSMCLNCNSVSCGLQSKCKSCGSENLDYMSRVTGYLQAVSGWNAGKKQELLDRLRYSL